jgi:hypothetical protein
VASATDDENERKKRKGVHLSACTVVLSIFNDI